MWTGGINKQMPFQKTVCQQQGTNRYVCHNYNLHAICTPFPEIRDNEFISSYTVVTERNDIKTRGALPSALVCLYMRLYVYLNPLFLKALIVVEVIRIIF